MPQILDHDKRWQHNPATGQPWTRSEIADRFPGVGYDFTPPTGDVRDLPPLEPFVQQSRWIVLCPWCSGAELMADDGLFFCFSCRNTAIGGDYIQVALPDRDTRLAVEALLTQRPDPTTRNWLAGETMQQLQQENIERLNP